LSKKIRTNSEQENVGLGKRIATNITSGDVLGFRDELCSGKTVLTNVSVKIDVISKSKRRIIFETDKLNLKEVLK